MPGVVHDGTIRAGLYARRPAGQRILQTERGGVCPRCTATSLSVAHSRSLASFRSFVYFRQSFGIEASKHRQAPSHLSRRQRPDQLEHVALKPALPLTATRQSVTGPYFTTVEWLHRARIHRIGLAETRSLRGRN